MFLFALALWLYIYIYNFFMGVKLFIVSKRKKKTDVLELVIIKTRTLIYKT